MLESRNIEERTESETTKAMMIRTLALDLILGQTYNQAISPYRYSANSLNLISYVTRFIVNSSNHTTPSNDSWIVDSAANAYITSYKTDLRFFVEKVIGEVKGFSGKTQMALGIGSITSTRNRITLKAVCYVTGNDDKIISMMKFKRTTRPIFSLLAPEIFTMTAVKGFKLTGHSVNIDCN